MAEEVYALPQAEDMKFYLLKGDRGDREGKYLWMIEFPTLAARQRYFPAPNETTSEAERVLASMASIFEKWETYATPINIIYTDYIEVGH